MMIEDDFDDIFKMMDRIFGNNPYRDKSPIHDNKYERLMDDDHIYYTFELPDMKKEDIDIKTEKDKLNIILFKNGREFKHQVNLPYPIKKDETKVTFVNGLLDITVSIDKDKAERINIDG